MAQAITESKEADRVAQAMSSDLGKVEPWPTSRPGHSFRYDGAVHAHLIEDGWRLTGFGCGWFTLKKE